MSASLMLKISRIKRKIDDLTQEHLAKSEEIETLVEALRNEHDPLREKSYKQQKEALEEALIEIEGKVEQNEKMLQKLSTLGGRDKFKEYFVKLNFELHKLAFKAYLDQDKKYGAFALHSNIRKNNLTWVFNNILLQYPQIGSIDHPWVLYMGDFKIEDLNELLDALLEHMEVEEDMDNASFEEKLTLIKDKLLARLETESIAIVIYGACEVFEENELDEEEVALKQIIDKVWKEIITEIEKRKPNGWLINFFIDRTGEFNNIAAEDFVISIEEEASLANHVLASIEEQKLLTLPEVKEITSSEFHKWVTEHLKKDVTYPGYPFKNFHEGFTCLTDCETYLGGEKINAEKLFAKICKQFGFKFKEEKYKWEIQ